ncbi:MAG: DUF1697 domain-containing protein [Bacteroidia bacterium]
MQKILSILRGVNVSGHKRIAMEDLRALYEDLGFKNIATYIQSGNVVFETEETDPQEIARLIEAKIAEVYGFNVPVIIRTAEEIQAVLADNPFLREMYIEEDRLHVTFLSEEPKPELAEKMSDQKFQPERFIVQHKEVYLYCPNGYGNTKLNNNYFEGKLKVSATTRNWRTINKLAEMLAE